MPRGKRMLTPEAIERVLFYTKEGESIAEICAELGISQATVSRGRRVLFREGRLHRQAQGRPVLSPEDRTEDAKLRARLESVQRKIREELEAVRGLLQHEFSAEEELRLTEMYIELVNLDVMVDGLLGALNERNDRKERK